MAVWGWLARLLLAAALLLFLTPSAVASAQSELPPKLDVDAATKALESNPIHRAPGAVAFVDEQRVRAELKRDMRVLVAPYSGPFDEEVEQRNYDSSDVYREQVLDPLKTWADDNDVKLIVVTGLLVNELGRGGYGPADINELRQTTAYNDVTEELISTVRRARGLDDAEATDFDYSDDKVVQPSPEQVKALVARLRQNRVYNAPGREDPIGQEIAKLADEKSKITVRVAAFPALKRGEPVIDYARALHPYFRDDAILVAYGRWLEVAGPNFAEIQSARDYAYGRFQNGSFRQGSPMENRMATVIVRLADLVHKTPFGRPQPPPQPKPVPFDVRATISKFAPWALVGSALLLGGLAIVGWRVRDQRQDAAARVALREASATTFAKIGRLGADILSVEERGERVNPAAAERHATARTLFDQAHTAEAMAEVDKVVDAGRTLMGGGDA